MYVRVAFLRISTESYLIVSASGCAIEIPKGEWRIIEYRGKCVFLHYLTCLEEQHELFPTSALSEGGGKFVLPFDNNIRVPFYAVEKSPPPPSPSPETELAIDPTVLH